MITVMDMDKCGVVECNIPITSLNFLIELPNLISKPEHENLGWNPTKVNVRKVAELEYKHSRVHKRG